MKKPKMILFDWGHTLMHEPEWNLLNGEKALYPYITENPMNLTAEQICNTTQTLFERFEKIRECGLEYHMHTLLRMRDEFLGLKYSVPMEEEELIRWRGISPIVTMPGIEALLEDLHRRGIRSGVVSNLGASSEALAKLIGEYIPNNRFEFIITSSDYGIRKPDPVLFQIALNRAELEPEDVWYCGDTPGADVEGAASAGIFPVWYDNEMECAYRNRETERLPECSYLYIREWQELPGILEKLS